MNVGYLHCDFLPLWAPRHCQAPNRDSPIENNRFFLRLQKSKIQVINK